MAWDFETDPDWEKQLDWVRALVQDEILPLDALELDHATALRAVRPLQERVKERGLWATNLGPELGGTGFGQVKLALLHEVLGGTELGPLVFGNHPPDSGNVELLAMAGTEEQKERWLAPLLAGDILSSFSMTEPDTGSDAKQITTSAVRDGDDWVINGHKWCVANARRSAFHIVLCVTDPDVHPFEGQSLIIVPTDTAGITMEPIGLIDDPEHTGALHEYAEIHYRDVRVPATNLLGTEGQAIALSQKRFGPGRVHHYMRWMGIARRAFDAMCERAVSVSVNGGPLVEKQFVQDFIARSVAELESARLLGLYAAWKLDAHGQDASRAEISILKYHGGMVMRDILDRSIQVHGSLGVSTHMPLARLYAYARTARIYDGPDELHKATVAKLVGRRYRPTSVPTDHVPTRRAAATEQFAHLFDAVSAQ